MIVINKCTNDIRYLFPIDPYFYKVLLNTFPCEPLSFQVTSSTWTIGHVCSSERCPTKFHTDFLSVTSVQITYTAYVHSFT